MTGPTPTTASATPAELSAPDRPGLAERLWEELGALAVARAGGRLVATFADRATADAARSVLGVGTVDLADSSGHLDAWRAWARPTRVGRLTIRPAWLDPTPAATPASIEVTIDPGHAFGHGGHPSTRLVLAALEARVGGGERVLDVGCGSGVLGIAALALGAGHVTAIDIDPVAVAVTRANAEANRVAERLGVSGAPLAASAGTFDVVVANIGVKVLRELAVPLAARVARGGWLALSGLLEHQWEEVADQVRAAAGWSIVEIGREEGWAAPILARAGG